MGSPQKIGASRARSHCNIAGRAGQACNGSRAGLRWSFGLAGGLDLLDPHQLAVGAIAADFVLAMRIWKPKCASTCRRNFCSGSPKNSSTLPQRRQMMWACSCFETRLVVVLIALEVHQIEFVD